MLADAVVSALFATVIAGLFADSAAAAFIALCTAEDERAASECWGVTALTKSGPNAQGSSAAASST